jgi:hypothetical protein
VRTRTRLAIVVPVLLVSVLAACGKGDVRPAHSGDPTTTTSEAPAADEGSGDEEAGDEGAAPAPDVTAVSVLGSDYAYEAEGDVELNAIPAGPVQVTLQNLGEEEHQISIVSLRDGKTEADFFALADDVSQLPAVLETWGGPNGVAPGTSATATQVLEPGDYYFVCFIPAPDGEPHAVKGMLSPVTVVAGDEAAAELEEPDTEIALQDYGFDTGGDEDEPVTAGDVLFTNDGPQPHEAAIYTLNDGATMDDVTAFFSSETPSGPPPVTPAGGVGPIDVGRTVTATLEPGDYVFICFIPDAGDGLPHLAHGMIRPVTVE